MKNLIFILSFVVGIFLSGCSIVPNRLGGSTSTSINAGQPNVFNYSVTSGSPVVIIPNDGTNIDWWIFAEDNSIRCLPQYFGTGTNVPTSSLGILVVGAGAPLNSYPLTDPTYEWECVATGTTAHVSVNIDKRQ